jgi:uncharacterized LabA/DUF88 family protein
MKKLALLIDGGCLRASAKHDGKPYDAALVEKVAHACVKTPDEELFRALYYDCDPFSGTVTLPVSKQKKTHQPRPQLMDALSALELFAVRRGTLKFRGWEPTTVPPTVDAHYAERFEQKGVDMRIGLDIADYSSGRFVDRIALITADTDMIPAMKHARRAGMQVVLVSMGSQRPSSELISHADMYRAVTWP